MTNPIRTFGPRPLKELGQHFLLDEEVAQDIVARLKLQWEERAFEIGPGRGILLRFLLKQSHKVTAIELDLRLQKSLLKTFGGHPGLELLFGDFLDFDLFDYVSRETSPVKIVGNIPYSISSLILLRLFDVARELQIRGQLGLKTAVLMLQKEVAQRICASPVGRAYGGITVFRALVSDAELLFDVPSEAFIPPPRVTSSVIRLNFYPDERYTIDERHLFRELVHTVFRQRRKMLKNTVRELEWINPDWRGMDFDLTRRPEELSVEEFIQLYTLLKMKSNG